MSTVFSTVLLVALPASGKSEVRNFLSHIEPERLKEEFHIGENLQLDDFPYVFMMRRIDEELQKLGHPGLYYLDGDTFTHNEDWGTLIHLLNEDFADMRNRRRTTADSAAEELFARIDAASVKAGLAPRLSLLPDDLRKAVAQAMEEEAKKLKEDKESQYPDDFTDKTIVIECARGGPDGAQMPLTGADGYQYSFAQLSPEILKEAVILYIWVTPEESRRKNRARANPDDPGSNLFHGTPEAVMLRNYGCDDMLYLLEQSDVENTITIKVHGETFHLPIGIFDNRVDKTSFLRGEKEGWTADLVDDMTKAVKKATDAMWEHYSGR
ncbi:MAG: hypothetical protein J5935_06270 [Lachnospiraceae bacterium]|nr:hypothetical protein [Lachnospiraceae bacterium]